MSNTEDEILELRRRVTNLEARATFLLRNLGIAYPEMPGWQASPEIMELVRRGRKTEAIKLFRQETGAGLKDAKQFIESLEV